MLKRLFRQSGFLRPPLRNKIQTVLTFNTAMAVSGLVAYFYLRPEKPFQQAMNAPAIASLAIMAIGEILSTISAIPLYKMRRATRMEQLHPVAAGAEIFALSLPLALIAMGIYSALKANLPHYDKYVFAAAAMLTGFITLFATAKHTPLFKCYRSWGVRNGGSFDYGIIFSPSREPVGQTPVGFDPARRLPLTALFGRDVEVMSPEGLSPGLNNF
jgi:hypothetical protein